MHAADRSVRPDRSFRGWGRFGRIKRRERPTSDEAVRRTVAGREAGRHDERQDLAAVIGSVRSYAPA